MNLANISNKEEVITRVQNKGINETNLDEKKEDIGDIYKKN